MKNLKKLASLVLALVMVFSLAATAFAAENESTLTIKTVDGHTYYVYQLLVGEVSDLVNGSGTLSNTAVGANAKAGTTVDAVMEAVSGKSGKALSDAAYALIDTTASAATVVGDGTDKEITVANGYYVVIDSWTDGAVELDSLSRYMVAVVGDTTMTPKNKPTDSNKRITSDDYADNLDGDDSVVTDVNAAENQNYNANNGAIGTVVWFEISAEVPANSADYNYYYLVLNDTLSKGLTLNPDSIKVYKSADGVLSTEADTLLGATTDYVVYTGEQAEGKTFQVAMVHAKDYANSTVFVTYSATINKDVEIGRIGELNTFEPVFSNNPNFDYDDETTDYKPDSTEMDAIGVGPLKYTRTYSTGILIRKVDQNGKPLSGAEFTLTGSSLKTTLVSTEAFEADENGTYYKLNDGTYTTEAPVASTMVEKTDRDSGYVVLTDGDTREGQVTVNGITYGPASDEELASSVQLYTHNKGNADEYVAPTDGKYTMYKKTVTLTEQVATDDLEIVQEVGADGYAYFLGLGEGEYTIKETKTPEGYNTIADMTLVIDWTADTDDADTDCTWNATVGGETVEAKTETITVPDGDDEGTEPDTKTVAVFDIEIVNVAGTNLPTTGGIGTTLFYVFGGIMVLAAVVLLVTKKRMGAAE